MRDCNAGLMLLLVIICCCLLQSLANRQIKDGFKPESNEDIPDSHKAINGIKLGRPVKMMDPLSADAAKYLLLYNYGSDACSGTPVQVSSVMLNVCFQQNAEGIYEYDDETPYYSFYPFYRYYYYFDSAGKVETKNEPEMEIEEPHKRHRQNRNSGAGSSSSKLRRQNYHYVYYYSISYSISEVLVDGVTEYYLNATQYTGAECTGSTYSTLSSYSGECQANNPSYTYNSVGYGASQLSILSNSSTFNYPSAPGVLTSTYPLAAYDDILLANRSIYFDVILLTSAIVSTVFQITMRQLLSAKKAFTMANPNYLRTLCGMPSVPA
jgi:hypothetical protein